MPDQLADLLRNGNLSPELFGLGVALLLLGVLRALLPEGRRALLRQPLGLLGLHLALLVVEPFLPAAGPAARALSLTELFLLLASIGRSSVVLVFDVVAGRRSTRPLPKILRDIAQGLVYLVVLLTALRSAGVEPGQLLTTSALLTAVVALSLQETLGNLVAGLAIQVQRPFDVDDWIQFDTEVKHIGRVIEINWRATKVVTLDEVEVIVPNAILAKAPITNFTKPTRVSRRSIYIQAPAGIPPHRVQALILEAVADSFGVVPAPPASVVTSAFVEGNVEYWVRFYTDRFERRDGVDGAARDRIWYAFARAGIPLPTPNRAIEMHEVSSASRAQEEAARASLREQALRHVDFLMVLSDEQRRELADQSRTRIYGAGEVIFRQGDDSEQMFVVESGEVAVVLERPRPLEDLEVARLGPGQFFGEMALMTGERRSATVRAAAPCNLLVIDQRAFRVILERTPEVAEHVSRVVAERHAARADTEAASARGEGESVHERSSQLLQRIRKFFALT